MTLSKIIEEFRLSAIPDRLTLANVQYIEGNSAVEILAEHAIAAVQKVSSYITKPAQKILDRYEFAAAGGWVAYGSNVNGTPGSVAVFKPFSPRRLLEDGTLKTIKYETPAKAQALPILPLVDEQTAQVIYQRYGVTPLKSESFWQVVHRCNLPVAITEGLKKALSLIAHGIPAIALRGVTCWHLKGTLQLHEAIAHFATPGRSIYVVFDQDQKPKTQRDVRIQVLKLSEVLEGFGSKVFVLTWDPTEGKGIDDVLFNKGREYEAQSNGILRESGVSKAIATNAKNMVGTYRENSAPKGDAQNRSRGFGFNQAARDGAHHLDLSAIENEQGRYQAEDYRRNSRGDQRPPEHPQNWFNALLQDAPTLNDYRRYGRLAAALAAIQQLNQLSCPVERETSGEYLPELPPIEPGKIHAVLAGMNSGKTTRIGSDWVKTAIASGWNVLVLSPLNALGQQTARDWELPHIHHFGQSTEQQSALWAMVSNSHGLVLCPDSLHRIPEWFFKRPLLLVLDEANQVIEHMATGDTLGSRWADILERFSAIAHHATNNGAIVASEDGLSDRAIGFLKTVSGCDSIRVFKHQKQSVPWDCTLFTGHQSGYRARLLQAAKSNRLMVVTSSQREAQRIERALLKLFPHLKVVRVDSQTNQQGTFNQFFEEPDQWLKINQPDVLILSPSAKSGVSIQGNVATEDAYFSSVWGYFPALATDTHMQLLGRYRPAVPRCIFVPPFITGTGDESLISQRAIKRRLDQNLRGLAGVYQLTDLLETQGDRAQTLIKIETAVLDYLATSKTVSGAEKSIAHDALVKRLEAAGHQVTCRKATKDSAIVGQWKQIQEEIWREDAQTTAAAVINPDLHTPEWARRSLDSLEASIEARTIAYKVLWREEFPGMLFDDPEECYQALCLDHGAMRRGVMLQARAENLEATKEGVRSSVEAILKAQIRAVHRLPKNYLRALLISKTGILELLNGQSYSNTDPRAVEVKKAALHWVKEIHYWLRLQIKPEQTPVEVCNKLIKKLGLEAVAVSRPGRRGQQINRVYQVIGQDNPTRMRLLEAFRRKLSSSVSTICNVIDKHIIQIVDTPLSTPPPEVLDDIRAMWAAADSDEAQAELRAMFPDEVLERAIAS